MTMNRIITVIGFLLIFSLSLASQNTDFGAWYGFNTDFKVEKGLKADFEASIRTDQNASHIETFYFEPGLRYKISRNFSAGLYYRFIEQDENDGKFHPRHRLSFQLKGDLPLGRFTFSARYRIQEQIRTYIRSSDDELPEWYHRLRIQADYNVPSIPLTPYASVELHSMLFSPNDIQIEKMRYTVGLDYTIKKKHTIGLAYIYNTSRVSNPDYMNIISVTYGISL